MTKELNGKTAIVTGASRGIGRTIALKLGAMNASVAVNYVNDEKAADSSVSAIENAGGKAVAVRADMRQVRDIQLLFDRTINEFCSVDILVNNARGINPHIVLRVDPRLNQLYKEAKAITQDRFNDLKEGRKCIPHQKGGSPGSRPEKRATTHGSTHLSG